MTPLVVENLSFKYRTRSELAIENVSLELKPGELLLVAGSSGCGKTTLARCINGLIPRSYRGERTGRVLLHGRDVAEMPIPEMAQVVGTLLQDPERQIVSSNVYNEVAFGPENLGLSRDEIVARIDQSLKHLNIEHLRERETFNLSGGEKQKVALAGVLAMNPSILLLDEPLASLDPASAHEALQVFRNLADEGKTVILIEHRVEDAITIQPDRMLYMEGGKIKYLGSIRDLPTEIDHTQVKLPAEWVVKRVKANQEIAAPPPRQEMERRSEPLVVFEDVDFRYNDDAPLVLQNVNLQINHGELNALLSGRGGPSSVTNIPSPVLFEVPFKIPFTEIGRDIPITVSKTWFALTQLMRMLTMAILAIPIPYTLDPNIYGTAFRRMGASDKVSFAADLAFRFVPTFARDFMITMDAQRARGYEVEKLKGGIAAKIRRLAPLIIPVVMQSTVAGEEVIDAMDLRAFGTAPRTWLKELHYAWRDYFMIALGVAIFITCCVLKWGFGIGGYFVPDFFTNFILG